MPSSPTWRTPWSVPRFENLSTRKILVLGSQAQSRTRTQKGSSGPRSRHMSCGWRRGTDKLLKPRLPRAASRTRSSRSKNSPTLTTHVNRPSCSQRAHDSSAMRASSAHVRSLYSPCGPSTSTVPGIGTRETRGFLPPQKKRAREDRFQVFYPEELQTYESNQRGRLMPGCATVRALRVT